MDCIKITNLEVFAHHGVFPEENQNGQNFYINAELYLSTRQAGLSDDLLKSVHYGEVCRLINKHLKEHTYKLLETAAEQVSIEIFKAFPLIEKLKLEICKPHAPIPLPFENVSVTIERGWQKAYIALGSNLGDKKAYMENAIKAMKERDDIRVKRVSSFLETKPYGGVEQEDFLNGVMEIDTLLSPEELLGLLQSLEKEAGRERKVHWGPRTLDLDILFYEDQIIATENLNVPHPDMKNRDFVLKPMVEIAPYLVHPVYRKTITEMLKEL
ncbi:MAG: 2-amino-4-hydroxy-6-hydroxymethyldihydropteridine diphosphokinase [Lachnospiraceae bacterium]|nr:2-amino-4-hydroxy-6-hydroxymethyldihydropteridine diphosphokinase [Lachnospiraceae bacterium]